jgi:hypothetical protein
MSLRRLTLGLAGVLALLAVPALAQPAERDHRHMPPPPPPPPGPPSGGPTEAPPPEQVEHPVTKGGFEWIGGHWDWHAGKWRWLAGHYERERAGQHWRAGRWEQRGGAWAWVEGSWGAGDAPPPPPPPGPPGPPPHEGHEGHEWHEGPPPELPSDRWIVSSYWPARGKVGTTVTIRGRNFAPDTEVLWRGEAVPGAKVGPRGLEISFQVPPGATTGEVAVGHPHSGHNVPVGQFEVVTSGDPDADWRRDEEAREKQAKEWWATREKELGKDRAAREAAWKKEDEERDRTREERREQRRAEIEKKWEAAFLRDPDTQAELTLHAQRIAELDRAKEVAELKDDGKLAVRVDVLTGRENARHDQRMAALQTAFKTKGGAP